MVGSKSENGLLFALQCRHLMYIIIINRYIRIFTRLNRMLIREYISSDCEQLVLEFADVMYEMK